MNKQTKWIAGVSASLALTGLMLAQDELEAPMFRTGTTAVQVPVTVRDIRGNFINGLAPVDFQLFDEGAQQNIKLDVTSHPISIVVAVQANRAAEQILPVVKKSASLFGPIVAGENGEVALVAYDHRVLDLVPFTSDPDVLKKGFEQIKAGSTPQHLDDAAMHAVNMLRTRKDRKRVLIIISETRDVGSSFSPRDVLTNAEFNNVLIYTVSMNHLLNILTSKTEPNRPNAVPPENRPPLPMGVLQTSTTDAQTNMGSFTPVIREVFTLVKGVFVPNSHEVFTKFTGGSEQNFVSLGGLDEALQNISEEIHSQYLVTFNAPVTAKAGYHELEVKVLSAPNLKITTRRGYWLAPQAPNPDAKDKAQKN
ncbi:MAG: VWA domain-containing protein [Acidobacteriota bacterium]